MTARRRTRFETCAITDAGDIVHLGAVNRTMSEPHGQVVVAFTVLTVCRMQSTRWTGHGVKVEDWPKGFDLPKMFHHGLLLVKYEPARTTIAPPTTCVVCATWPEGMDFDAPA